MALAAGLADLADAAAFAAGEPSSTRSVADASPTTASASMSAGHNNHLNICASFSGNTVVNRDAAAPSGCLQSCPAAGARRSLAGTRLSRITAMLHEISRLHSKIEYYTIINSLLHAETRKIVGILNLEDIKGRSPAPRAARREPPVPPGPARYGFAASLPGLALNDAVATPVV